MKDIFIVLTGTNTIFSRAIKIYTGKAYSHSSISLDINLDSMFSMSRKYNRNPFIGVFKKEEFGQGVFNKCPNCPMMVARLPVTDKQYDAISYELLKLYTGNIDYNIMGILFRLINREYENEGKFFCSEMIAYLLYKTDIYKFDKPLNFVEPMDLLNIPSLEIIFEGMLCEYSNYINPSQVIDGRIYG
ncbi:hypothetical protein [Clostridium cellulovorans]|uniref:Uncharacterized protein n=1 Tax=Clostridium cellulovorans (strain ATCC 35296 / DSM 3052 / OCM 3 / 743B) TaxID=573061 RepID=D9SNJ6_CLOC7|nr:hypothetical protein [Clostridium cellulovorans]ADL53988.1 hypothetical protein Clocel_4331 [Clostridium cellulovorans 743B]